MNPHSFALFAAGVGDLFEYAVVIIVVIASIIRFLSGLIQQAATKPKAGAPPGNPEQKALQSEIEQFLRTAEEQKREKGKGPRPAGGKTAKPNAERPRNSERGKQGNRNKPPPLAPVVMAEMVPEALSQRRSLADTIASDLRNEQFERPSDSFSQIPHEADDIKQHVRDVFEHRVGSLATEADLAATAAANTAQQQATLDKKALITKKDLLAPRNIRTAIILNEILHRPTDRW
ncbi:MAG: hypothetical protein SFX18_14190 [Pirellulales bacterium]|nr:hypothetical protein [Pirellulales bacterium]